jgi:hypothetical protein
MPGYARHRYHLEIQDGGQKTINNRKCLQLRQTKDSSTIPMATPMVLRCGNICEDVRIVLISQLLAKL